MSETNIFTIYGTDPFLIELKRDEVFSELKKNNFFIREIFFNNDRTFKFESLYLFSFLGRFFQLPRLP